MSDYPEKYNTLIDAETWAFIEKSNAMFPADASDLPVERKRELYDAMAREFFADYPNSVETADLVVEGRASVPVRTYRNIKLPAKAQVVYLHGGGFVFGGLNSHDDVCSELCGTTGFKVISVDYRLAPEHQFPADFDDALAGYSYALSQSDLPVIMVGDSAGANLAAAVCHHVRGMEREPVGQVLVYPCLGGETTRGSYVEHSNAPLLSTRDIGLYNYVRTNGTVVEEDPIYAPLHDSDFASLPPTVVITADCDPLRDDGRAYCERIVQAGGKAHWINEEGLVHGYLRARHCVNRAGESFSRFIDAVSALGQGKWPY